MSAAAAALLRAMLNRAKASRDRILLTGIRSTDWQSLTFVGERHEIEFRITGPGAGQIASQLTDGIEDAELSTPGSLVADIAVTHPPRTEVDGSLTLRIEALTISELG